MMLPEAFRPPRFLFWLVFLDLLAVTLALGTSVVLHGHPSVYMEEGEWVTWLSFGHLLVTGGLAGIVFRLRTHGSPPLRGWRDPRWIWLILAVGFLYLAVDEVATLHESVDRLVHRLFGWQETGLSDRLDDVIVLGYGALGVVVLYAYRTELAACREVLPLVRCSVILFAFMVGMDMLSNRSDVFRAVGVPRDQRGDLSAWARSIEESLKIGVEATLLGAMYTCTFIIGSPQTRVGRFGRSLAEPCSVPRRQRRNSAAARAGPGKDG